MSNLASLLAKLLALAGGAVRTRYAEGLAPIQPNTRITEEKA